LCIVLCMFGILSMILIEMMGLFGGSSIMLVLWIVFSILGVGVVCFMLIERICCVGSVVW